MQMRMGVSANVLENTSRASIAWEHAQAERAHVYDGEQKMRLGLFTDYERSFPRLPEEWVVKAPSLMQAFLVDYSLHRLELLRELKTVVSTHALSVDHQ